VIVEGTCPRCKTERQLTVLIGGLFRCGFCSLLLRAETVHSTVERIDRSPVQRVESAG
jgi:hypothetical protein